MHSLTEFEIQQPFATQFFTQALKNRQLVNSYILQGRDLATMYRMVLRLAQIINCKAAEEQATACGQCQSCRWIEENAHPGVMTVTNMTYLLNIDPETGEIKSKTGKPQQSIAVSQLEALLKELSLHSGGFHRVVVLAKAQESQASEPENDKYAIVPPKDWSSSQNGQLELLPLDQKVFTERVANKFLKTLEEPPMDTLFFLLTDDRQRLLETIVSRCQVVTFQTPKDFYHLDISPSLRDLFMDLLAQKDRVDFLSQYRRLTTALAEHELPMAKGLSQFQRFLWEQLSIQGENEQYFSQIKHVLKQVEHAQSLLDSRVKEDYALEAFFASLQFE